MEQPEGQIASAKIAMARLSSPQLYYVLSGNDFTLDINNPVEPKIVCMGNNLQKIQIYRFDKTKGLLQLEAIKWPPVWKFKTLASFVKITVENRPM